MAPRPRLRPQTAGIIIAILAVVVLAVDQFTKYLALTGLPLEQLVPVWGDVLGLYLIRNSGAAFSFGSGVTWIFTLALAAVVVVIVVLAVRIRSRAWAIVLGLLLGGVLGNLGDRLFRDPGFGVGHVVDFISTPWMWFWTTPAIYNVADMFIVTSMIAVAVLVVSGLRLDGTRERGRRDADDVRED
ncbi:MAG: signal peptidase II [Microbacterium sp.]|uniref:signal peptidase II n=1 Tax=Microbacterium sp. TaxID=51671 RepID=UPI0039E56C05